MSEIIEWAGPLLIVAAFFLGMLRGGKRQTLSTTQNEIKKTASLKSKKEISEAEEEHAEKIEEIEEDENEIEAASLEELAALVNKEFGK